jgi:hypothetical protein
LVWLEEIEDLLPPALVLAASQLALRWRRLEEAGREELGKGCGRTVGEVG